MSAALLAGAGVDPLERFGDAGVRGEDDLAARTVTALQDRLTAASAGAGLAVVADGLDEARNPLVVGALLRDVGELAACRVLVGTRASTTEGPDQPDPDLLDTLVRPTEGHGLHGRSGLLTLVRDPDSIDTYVRQRLTALERAHVEHVARQVAHGTDRAGRPREFLFARLIAHEILDDPSLAHERAVLDRLLAGDHRTLFRHAVARVSAASATTGALVAALAHARGRGIPRADGLWAAAAHALSGIEITEADVDTALEQAAPYFLLDGEHGQSVYRLAHYTFVEHFLVQAEFAERERAVFDGLLASAAAAVQGGGRLNPYLVHHLVEHVAAAGESGWNALAGHEPLLDRIDPGSLADEAMARAIGRFPVPAQVLAMIPIAKELAAASATDRPGQRRLGMATQGVSHFGSRLPGAAWTVRSATRRPIVVHRVLAGHTDEVSGVAAFTGPGGRARLATTSADAAVRIWDPDTGVCMHVISLGVTASTVTGLGGDLILGLTDGWARIRAPPAPTGQVPRRRQSHTIARRQQHHGHQISDHASDQGICGGVFANFAGRA